MVGVARIELATPAMSRQVFDQFLTVISHFFCITLGNNIRTKDSFDAFLPHFYRTRFSGCVTVDDPALRRYVAES